MRFEWDHDKAIANEAKHGVPFDYATRVFLDPKATVVEDTRRRYGEERMAVCGVIEGRLHVVIFTMRGDVCRLISARKANERESRAYHHL